jgi:hypothetical protein
VKDLSISAAVEVGVIALIMIAPAALRQPEEPMKAGDV